MIPYKSLHNPFIIVAESSNVFHCKIKYTVN